MKRTLLFSIALLLSICTPSLAQTISTIAGGLGHGGAATAVAQLISPCGIAVDDSGNTYIADGSSSFEEGSYCIRKITPSGINYIIAGTGERGYSGDGGYATVAKVSYGGDIEIDAYHNIYFCEYDSCRVRKISAAGIITTIAGNGTAASTGDGGPATAAGIYHPSGVAVDTAGNIYIAELIGHKIRKINTAGIISTFAGTGLTTYNGDNIPATAANILNPIGISVYKNTHLLVCEWNNARVRKISFASDTINTIAGNGTRGTTGDSGLATAALVNYPSMAVGDTFGNIYISDNAASNIRKISTSGIISTFAGVGAGGNTGDGGLAMFARINPYALATDKAGNLYMTSSWLGDCRARKINRSTNIITTIAGPGNYGGDGGQATSATIWSPSTAIADGAGNIYIADQYNHAVRKVSNTGIISTIAGNGTAGYGGDGGPAVAARLDSPMSLALDVAGNLYIADMGNNVVRKVSTAGTISTYVGNGTAGYGGDGGPAASALLNRPNGIKIDSASGDLYIADMSNHRIRQVSRSTGNIRTAAGDGTAGYGGDGGPAGSASISSPSGIALDAAGNLYIADMRNNRIRQVSRSTGNISTFAGNGTAGYGGDGGPAASASISSPTGVAIDRYGNMLIADDSNGRVRIITPGGTISTIAGSGIRTYGGDGGPAARASMSVSRVSVDNADNMYIADGVCNRIRKIGNYRLLIGSTNGIAYTPVIVYPNPATNVISIELPAPLTVASTVNLYNLSGQKVLTTKFEAMQSKTLQLSIGSLPEAVYTAEVVAGGNPTYYAKVVLLR